MYASACCTALLLLSYPGSDNRDLSIETIAAAISTRQAKYRNLTFEYVSDERLTPRQPGDIDTFGKKLRNDEMHFRNTLCIVDPTAGFSRPSKLWQRLERLPNGDWVVERFLDYDGKKSVSFIREDRVAEGKWNAGRIVPFEEPDKFQLDIFELFLFLGLDGPSNTFLFGSDPGNTLRWTLSDTHRDERGQAMHVLSGTTPNAGLSYRAEVTTVPECLVTLWEIRLNDELVQRYQVTERNIISGISYPGAGTYHQWPMAHIPEHTYSFRVKSAGEIAPGDLTTLTHEWPAGTIVEDQVNNTNFTIKHDIKEVAAFEMRRRADELRATKADESRWSSRHIFVAINVGMIVLIAAVAGIGVLRRLRDLKSSRKRVPQ